MVARQNKVTAIKQTMCYTGGAASEASDSRGDTPWTRPLPAPPPEITEIVPKVADQ